MQWPDNYKIAFKSYREGFALGVFTGLASWLFIGNAIYALPLMLGMLFGSIAFQLKLRALNKSTEDDQS